MIQSDELGKFKRCERQKYDTINIYIHKTGFPTITVSAPNPVFRVDSYRIKYLQVSQYAQINGTRQKAVARVQFNGWIIFTLLQKFNEMICQQILEYVENISSQLRQWCAAPIVNMFMVQQKTMQSLGFKHGFIKIIPLYVYLQKNYYFQFSRWTADTNSEIPSIQSAEKVKGTSSYAGMMDYVWRKILQEKQRRRLAKQQKQREKLQRQLIQDKLKQRLKNKQQNKQQPINMSPYDRPEESFDSAVVNKK